MKNSETAADTSASRMWERLRQIISQDRYKWELIACLAVGILFGCVTQSVYGNRRDWVGLTERYCIGLKQPFWYVAPITVGFLVAIAICSSFRTARYLVFPLAAFRGMGFGALICGAMQLAQLRELCFSALVLLPYCVCNCVIAVYAGEYALGFRPSFNGWNEGLSNKLIWHGIKMFVFYMAAALLSCAVFAVSCCYFGRYLI